MKNNIHFQLFILFAFFVLQPSYAIGQKGKQELKSIKPLVTGAHRLQTKSSTPSPMPQPIESTNAVVTEVKTQRIVSDKEIEVVVLGQRLTQITSAALYQNNHKVSDVILQTVNKSNDSIGYTLNSSSGKLFDSGSAKSGNYELRMISMGKEIIVLTPVGKVNTTPHPFKSPMKLSKKTGEKDTSTRTAKLQADRGNTNVLLRKEATLQKGTKQSTVAIDTVPLPEKPAAGVSTQSSNRGSRLRSITLRKGAAKPENQSETVVSKLDQAQARQRIDGSERLRQRVGGSERLTIESATAQNKDWNSRLHRGRGDVTELGVPTQNNKRLTEAFKRLPGSGSSSTASKLTTTPRSAKDIQTAVKGGDLSGGRPRLDSRLATGGGESEASPPPPPPPSPEDPTPDPDSEDADVMDFEGEDGKIKMTHGRDSTLKEELGKAWAKAQDFLGVEEKGDNVGNGVAGVRGICPDDGEMTCEVTGGKTWGELSESERTAFCNEVENLKQQVMSSASTPCNPNSLNEPSWEEVLGPEILTDNAGEDSGIDVPIRDAGIQKDLINTLPDPGPIGGNTPPMGGVVTGGPLN